MPKTRVLTQQAEPGANLGEAFTASIAQRNIAIQGGEGYWDSLSLGIKGDTAVAVVALTDFLSVVQPITILANETRINARGVDLFALHAALYGYNPAFIEGAIGQDDKVYGIRIPLWIKPKSTESYAYSITRVAQTNLSGEVVSLALNYRNAPPAAPAGRIDAREIPFTTGAATGIQTAIEKLPKLGKLLGLLLFCTTVPTETADSSSVQRLKIKTPKTTLVDATWHELHNHFQDHIDFVAGDASELVLRQVLDNYGFLDFRDEPIDVATEDVSVTIDNQAVSSAVRFIPVIEVPQ